MKTWLLSIIVAGLVFFTMSSACAPKIKHIVETKDPIVIDVRARIDIYQHAVDIEDMVSGKKPIPAEEKTEPKKKQGSILFVSTAYAEEAPQLKYMTEEVENAIRSRRERFDELKKFKQKGYIGEDHIGLVRFRETPHDEALHKEMERLVDAENHDRDVIYKAIAEQNGISSDKVKEAFAQVQRDRAEHGEWIEVKNEKNEWVWKQK